MGPLKLQNLIDRLASNADVAWTGDSRLMVSASPAPYIAPKFHIRSTTASGTTAEQKLGVEVIFVRASAAVGKTITAKHISALAKVPVLDLTTVGVGGGSLFGLLSSSARYGDRQDPTRAINDFHEGRLPIIEDALDEGRMVSGDTSFVEFLETTGELILENRSVKTKPKIIFFGRQEATELSDVAVQLAGELDITTCVIELDFFTEEEASALIKAYMNIESPGINVENINYTNLIELYFTRIEHALRIKQGHLWQDPIGKGFAGYAPVLSAIGRLLAKIEQPHVALDILRHDGEEPAWAVIENVMHFILNREQTKVTTPLQEKFGNVLKSDALEKAYNVEEQLAYLAQLVQGQPIVATGRVDFGIPNQNQTYIENVRGL